MLVLSLLAGCSEGSIADQVSPITEEAGESPDAQQGPSLVISDPETEALLAAEAAEQEGGERAALLSAVLPLPTTTATINVRTMRNRVRRRQWAWMDAADARERTWSIPDGSELEVEATGLLRICMSENGGVSDNDCIGQWQVAHNIRSRTCDRRRTRITECDDQGETILSAMRRLGRHVMGMVAPRNYRQRWTREITLDCETPPSYHLDDVRWQTIDQPHCLHTAELVRELVRERDQGLPLRSVTGREEPVGWGGRCDVQGGACDDWHACRRGLASIETDTLNRFWRRARPGEVDPICVPFLRTIENAVASESEDGREGDGDGAQDEPREGEGPVSGPPESVQRRDISAAGPVVLDLHELPGDGQRQDPDPS